MNALRALPEANARRLAVRVQPFVERVLRDGHPWLYADGITHISREGAAGDIAVVFDRKKRFLAAGLYDPFSPIRVRLLVHRRPQTIDGALFDQRLAAAQETRAPLAAAGTEGYRLVHGANDGLPGVVIDRYAGSCVLKLYSAAWLPHLPRLVDALRRASGAERLVLRLSRQLLARKEALHGLFDGQTLLGPAAQSVVAFHENGLLFEADIVHGQKTGFFLDQRDNRRRVGELAASRSVLNAFSYSGGFSLYAARGGAAEVTDIDQSRPALEAAKRHFFLNRGLPGIAAARHEIFQGDVFSVLADLAGARRRFDMVILDPPAFARRKEEVPGALKAYGRLLRMGLAVLNEGGIIAASSCSSRVTAEAFYATLLRTASEEGRPLQELERSGHALDHPISFPEGAYLKTLFAVVP